MPRRFLLFVCLVSAAAGLLAVQFAFALQTQLHALDWEGVAAFVGVGLIVNFAALSFGGDNTSSAASSIAFLPFLTCTVIFPPPAAALIVFVVVGLTEVIKRWKKPAIAAFNTSQALLSVGAASLMYTALANGQPAQVNLAAFPVAASTFFLTNILLTSAGIALYQQTAWTPVVRQAIGPMGGNLLYDLFASPIAIVIAWLYRGYSAPGVILVLIPLLLVRHLYASRLKLELATLDLLEVLVKAIETRDPYTSGHSRRVSELAKAIATDMGLSGRLIGMIGRAALLHDIGKIDAAYSTVIMKPHDLTEEERILIRTHAAKGAELLAKIASVDKRVVAAVRHHHERYDGTGYPSGLKGTEIPLAARIIMLSDSVDAMLSDRPYRKALPVSTVRSELQKFAGTQFDPHIVQVILSRDTLERAEGLVTSISPPIADAVSHSGPEVAPETTKKVRAVTAYAS